MSQTSTKVDMLNGPLFMKILIFALPLAASSLLQQLFNSVDVAVVGRFASSKALAAVGSNAPVISLLINLFVGISMGANVVLSNHLGQRDDEGVRRTVSTVSLVGVVSGVLLMLIGIGVSRPILELMDTPADVLDMAVLYLRLYFVGIPFFLIFNFGAAILRSVGDTRRPLYILVVAGVINTVLNLVLVICFGLGVEGVAIATAIANMVSAACIVVLLRREKGALQLQFNHMRIYGKELRRMLQIGVPAGLQGMVFSLSNVVVQSAINGYGSAAIAGSAAAVNFEYYCYYIIVACNGAAISFIGQNYGAGKYDRVRRIFRICMLMGLVGCFAANALFTWQKPLLPQFLHRRPRSHSLRSHTYAGRPAISVLGLQLRNLGLCLAWHGRVHVAHHHDRVRHLRVAHGVGLCGESALPWVCTAVAGIPVVVGAHRRHGACSLSCAYEKAVRSQGLTRQFCKDEQCVFFSRKSKEIASRFCKAISKRFIMLLRLLSSAFITKVVSSCSCPAVVANV